jgi:hypothetical protein
MALSYADILQMRDTIRQMTKEAINDILPGPKYGVVQPGLGWRDGYQTVILNGETTPMVYPVGTIASEVANDIVLIEGPNNNRRVTDVITQDAAVLNAKTLRTVNRDLGIISTGITGGPARSIVNVVTGAYFVQFATSPAVTTGDNVFIIDGSRFRVLNRDLAIQGGTVATDTMATTTSAANVRWAGGQFLQVTSFTELKTDIEEIDIDYYFLNLRTYTWRDAQEVERHPDTTQRYSGTLFEEVKNRGYPMYLSYKEDGDPMGIEETKFYSKMIPIMRGMHMRINVLEGKDAFDGLAAPTAATTAGQGEVFVGDAPVLPGPGDTERSADSQPGSTEDTAS